MAGSPAETQFPSTPSPWKGCGSSTRFDRANIETANFPVRSQEKKRAAVHDSTERILKLADEFRKHNPAAAQQYTIRQSEY